MAVENRSGLIEVIIEAISNFYKGIPCQRYDNLNVRSYPKERKKKIARQVYK